MGSRDSFDIASITNRPPLPNFRGGSCNFHRSLNDRHSGQPFSLNLPHVNFSMLAPLPALRRQHLMREGPAELLADLLALSTDADKLCEIHIAEIPAKCELLVITRLDALVLSCQVNIGRFQLLNNA